MASQQSPLRLYVDGDGDLGTTTDRGYLVYERAYQTDFSVPTDQWVTDNLMTAKFWEVWLGNNTFDTAGNFQPLSVWGSATGFTPSGSGLHLSASSVVYGLSVGIGSGWYTYVGAVDNVSIGFGGGDPTTFNFEVVPEPSSLVLAGMAGIGCAMAIARRRRTEQ